MPRFHGIGCCVGATDVSRGDSPQEQERKRLNELVAQIQVQVQAANTHAATAASELDLATPHVEAAQSHADDVRQYEADGEAAVATADSALAAAADDATTVQSIRHDAVVQVRRALPQLTSAVRDTVQAASDCASAHAQASRKAEAALEAAAVAAAQLSAAQGGVDAAATALHTATEHVAIALDAAQLVVSAKESALNAATRASTSHAAAQRLADTIRAALGAADASARDASAAAQEERRRQRELNLRTATAAAARARQSADAARLALARATESVEAARAAAAQAAEAEAAVRGVGEDADNTQAIVAAERARKACRDAEAAAAAAQQASDKACAAATEAEAAAPNGEVAACEAAAVTAEERRAAATASASVARRCADEAGLMAESAVESQEVADHRATLVRQVEVQHAAALKPADLTAREAPLNQPGYPLSVPLAAIPGGPAAQATTNASGAEGGDVSASAAGAAPTAAAEAPVAPSVAAAFADEGVVDVDTYYESVGYLYDELLSGVSLQELGQEDALQLLKDLRALNHLNTESSVSLPFQRRVEDALEFYRHQLLAVPLELLEARLHRDEDLVSSLYAQMYVQPNVCVCVCVCVCALGVLTQVATRGQAWEQSELSRHVPCPVVVRS